MIFLGISSPGKLTINQEKRKKQFQNHPGITEFLFSRKTPGFEDAGMDNPESIGNKTWIRIKGIQLSQAWEQIPSAVPPIPPSHFPNFSEGKPLGGVLGWIPNFPPHQSPSRVTSRTQKSGR